MFERLTDAWRAEPIKSSRVFYPGERRCGFWILFSTIFLSPIFSPPTFRGFKIDRSLCTRKERMKFIKKSIAAGMIKRLRANSFRMAIFFNFFHFSSLQSFWFFFRTTRSIHLNSSSGGINISSLGERSRRGRILDKMARKERSVLAFTKIWGIKRASPAWRRFPCNHGRVHAEWWSVDGFKWQ